MRMANVPATEMKVASAIHIVPQDHIDEPFLGPKILTFASWRLGVRSLFRALA